MMDREHSLLFLPVNLQIILFILLAMVRSRSFFTEGLAYETQSLKLRSLNRTERTFLLPRRMIFQVPPERFYERFAGLYRLADPRTQISFKAFVQLGKMAVKGQSFVMRRMFSAARDMRSASGYLAYPGSIPKPDWVPEGFGSSAWVDRSRSPLVEQALKTA